MRKESLMLVLSRKIDESILIGEDVEVTILRIVGNKVRLGIKAPHDVSILRTELLQSEETSQPTPVSQ